MSETDRPKLVVGLTGGVASGKSAVSECFRKLGVPVIDADALGREVVKPGSPALKEVVRQFGRDVLNPDGTLDRRQMRRLIFANEGTRRKLEATLHPWISALMDARLAGVAGEAYAVVAIPLLFEAGWDQRVDRVLVVDADRAMQLERVMKRDDVNRTMAESMLRAQMDRDERLGRADDTLSNTGSLADLEAGVRALNERYTALSAAQA